MLSGWVSKFCLNFLCPPDIHSGGGSWQPIAWLIMTEINSTEKNQYRKSVLTGTSQNVEHNKILPRFCCPLRHSARKQGELTLYSSRVDTWHNRKWIVKGLYRRVDRPTDRPTNRRVRLYPGISGFIALSANAGHHGQRARRRARQISVRLISVDR